MPKPGNGSGASRLGLIWSTPTPKVHRVGIHRSFALHELKRTQEACDLLVPAAALFPKEWLIRYNLACYSCQLGDLEEAGKWLSIAFSLGDAKHVKLMALNDPDLKPLRTENGGFNPRAGLA